MELFIIFGSISAVIIYSFFTRHQERMARIEKNRHYFFELDPPASVSGGKSLLFGMIATSIGVAFLLGAVVIARRYDRDMMMCSLLFIFTGLASIGYWRITKPDRDLSRRLYDKRLEETHPSLTETE